MTQADPMDVTDCTVAERSKTRRHIMIGARLCGQLQGRNVANANPVVAGDGRLV
jgi:hypothetical protein